MLSRASAALAAATALTLSSTAPPSSHPGGGTMPEDPEHTEVEVHDPSVVTAGDETWVFGSHLAAASTEDFITWEQEANLPTPENPLFEDVTTELAETFEWAETDTLWAPDVFQLADGRYAMYYNACEGSSPRSAMGIATSDDVDGPYEDQGIILRSGHREDEGPSEDGTPYDARKHPNVVDPDVFRDAQGTLWMVYGSYSGGIFILELDEETGEPLPGQGYGKHLMGGNHSRIEAPSIMHDPETGYYYLFTSFGGLTADGGYNIRVVRSTSPDGPYYDAAGNRMDQVAADPSEPIFDDDSIEPFGTLVMDGFQLSDGAAGSDPQSVQDLGYVSPGHNTTSRDPETGRMELIFHTRFPGEGERHQVRTHRMQMTEDGWPVAAPLQESGEPMEKVHRPGVPGEYELVAHDREISGEPTPTRTVTLREDGTVVDAEGETIGSWRLEAQNRATITLDGVEHDGIFAEQVDPAGGDPVLTLSVLSDDGKAVWGVQTAAG